MAAYFVRKFPALSLVALLVTILGVLAVFAGSAIAQNPVPFIDQPLVPDAATPGGAAFTLTVNGAGFVAASVVNWNGSPRATTFISSAKLTAAILASDIAKASTASVTVVSPSPGGGISSPLFFPIHTPTAVAAFSTADYGQVSGPWSIATGDFKGDGNVDLVVSANDWGAVSVLLGNGDGTFQNPVEYAVGGYPVQAIVGDFDGDGKLDLAAPYNGPVSGQGGFAVLLGNGDGTFRTAANYSTPCLQGGGGLTADFNRDGNLDLLTLNGCSGQDTDTIGIQLGNGDGTFQPPVNYNVGLYPNEAAVGDFNGDGFLDVAVANGGSNTVSVLLGNGDGTFQPAVSYPTAGPPQGVNIAALGGNGKLDLIVPNYSNSVSVLLGNGDGTFQPHVDYALANGALSSKVGDFNEDGNLDVAVTTTAPGLDLLLGNGDGTLQPALPFTTSFAPLYPEDIVIADFNGDGRLDAALLGDAVWVIAVMLQAAPVSNAPTTTTLVSSLNPSVYGQAFTLTAQVTSTSGTPTGALLFAATPDYGFPPGLLTNGQISTGVPGGFVAGTTSVTAAYQGITGFDSSTSTPLNQVVNKAATATTLASSANPARISEGVTYTATVTSQYGGGATGTVTFQDNGATVATVALSRNRAAYSTKYKEGGTDAITATYSGDASNLGSTSATLTEYIESVTTKTVVTTSGSPSHVGQPVTFTATVTPTQGAIPDGELMTFYDHGIEIGTGTTTSGVATFTTSSLIVKTHAIEATYAGDATFEPSFGTVKQVVDKYTTTTALSSSPNPSNYGQAVTFTAEVTSAGPTPTGKMLFKDGTKLIQSVTLSGGIAALTTSKLAVGTHSITAEYEGDANSGKSTSSVLDQVVQ